MLHGLNIPILLGLVCFLVYNANLRQIGAGDSLPARYLPLILWHDRSFDFDANARLVASGHSMIPDWKRPLVAGGQVAYFEPWAYWMVRTHQNQLASLYPVVTPLLVTPLYFPAVIWLDAHGWEQPHSGRVAEVMEKLAASLVASAASVLMYFILRLDGTRWSIPLTLGFAFGTNTWMISSQALWGHGCGELLIALGLLLALAPASPARIALLGAVCILIIANRPPDAIVAAAIALVPMWRARHNALWLLAGGAAPLAALVTYNLGFIGHIGGGYALAKSTGSGLLQLDWSGVLLPSWSGVAGLLVSPTRGLLFFSPFLAFVPVGLIHRLRAPHTRALAMALSMAVIVQILVYSLGDWRAGVSWGPRWLTDLLPILVWMAAPAPLVLRPIARQVFMLALAVSIGIQVIGAFWYTKTSDARIFAGDPGSLDEAWNLSNVPFLVELGHPPAPGELQCDAVGALDRIGSTALRDAGELPGLRSGDSLEGWALACRRTPAQMVVLIDGIVVGATTRFQSRVGVNESILGEPPSGWGVVANILGVGAGERVLQLAVRVEPRSDFRIVHERRVEVIQEGSIDSAAPILERPGAGSDLEAMAAQAASLLRDHQSTEGYWLTWHTTGPRYEAPHTEMNTYVTSILVDMLSPISGRWDLGAPLERARQHLAAQIESDGLVRYHGLPDGPGIGRLGCVITPDADDTALVWRIAGPGSGDPRRQLALDTLASYRDARGLYRTWLAPQSAYQCIDPGRDPNPTDIAIQMHVYQMLRQIDPIAAQNLCDGLQRAISDPDTWVYYTESPLVPYLRSAELSEVGCAIPLPAERLSHSVVGQEVWSDVARWLVSSNVALQNAEVREAIRDLLIRMGSGDFAQVRGSPPLLYHNDLSATVRRFYWSEDFGLALWLRLHEALNDRTTYP